MPFSKKRASQREEAQVEAIIADHESPPLSVAPRPADEEPRAFARPSQIGEFYIEQEYGHGAREQIENHAEQGEISARPAKMKARRLGHDADHAIKLSDRATEDALKARLIAERAWEALHLYIRRPIDAKWLKYVRWLGLLGGDVAGVSGAAILLGEQFINAFMQAASAGMAAVTLGAVGRELRYSLSARARQKDPEELAEEEKPYAQFFKGPHEGEVLIKLILGTALGAICILATGIFALRDQTEGFIAGVTFGCIALVVGLSSLANAFDAADDLAEMLDNLFSHVKKLEKYAITAREALVIKDRDEAAAEADSEIAAWAASGRAAAEAVYRQLGAALNNGVGIVGHGTAASVEPSNEKTMEDNIESENIDDEEASNGHHKGRTVLPPEPIEEA